MNNNDDDATSKSQSQSQSQSQSDDEHEVHEPEHPRVVLLLNPIPIFISDDWSSALSAANFTLVPPSSPLSTSAQALLLVGGLQAVPVTHHFLTQYPSLRCVVTTSTGLNRIDMEACAQRGILVANNGTTYTTDVADYAVGLLLDVMRRITISDRYLRNGLWLNRANYPLGSKLGGKRVGIVGLGSIGSAIAKRLEAFGCKIFYLSRKPKPNNYRYIANIRDLATECDILVVSCSLTKETHHIINKQVLQALGKEGIIINIGRGAHIDEPELVRCLVRGEIKGVGLDVYENEPNVPKELIEMENHVVLTPHRAVFTPDAMADVIRVCIANFEAFFAGKPLITPVVRRASC